MTPTHHQLSPFSMSVHPLRLHLIPLSRLVRGQPHHRWRTLSQRDVPFWPPQLCRVRADEQADALVEGFAAGSSRAFRWTERLRAKVVFSPSVISSIRKRNAKKAPHCVAALALRSPLLETPWWRAK